MSKESKESKERKGETVITSVSVSREFKKLVEKHEVSPTEAYRKGIALCLYEKGVPEYINEVNKQRYEALKNSFEAGNFEELILIIDLLFPSLKRFRVLLETLSRKK